MNLKFLVITVFYLFPLYSFAQFKPLKEFEHWWILVFLPIFGLWLVFKLLLFKSDESQESSKEEKSKSDKEKFR